MSFDAEDCWHCPTFLVRHMFQFPMWGFHGVVLLTLSKEAGLLRYPTVGPWDLASKVIRTLIGAKSSYEPSYPTTSPSYCVLRFLK